MPLDKIIAEEINNYILRETMGIVTNNNSSDIDAMLRKIFDYAIECHDYNGPIPAHRSLNLSEFIDASVVSDFVGFDIPHFQFKISSKESFRYKGLTGYKDNYGDKSSIMVMLNEYLLDDFNEFRSTFMHELTHVCQLLHGDNFGGEKNWANNKKIPMKTTLSKHEISARINDAYQTCKYYINNGTINTKEELWNTICDETYLKHIEEKIKDDNHGSLNVFLNNLRKKSYKVYINLLPLIEEKV